MRGRLEQRRWRLLTLVGGTLYALFLIAAPFSHHDIDCHRKTPLHCSSCTSSPLGADPHPLGSPGTAQLDDAGPVVGFQLQADSILLTVRSTGRSPPRSRLTRFSEVPGLRGSSGHRFLAVESSGPGSMRPQVLVVVATLAWRGDVRRA